MRLVRKFKTFLAIMHNDKMISKLLHLNALSTLVKKGKDNSSTNERQLLEKLVLLLKIDRGFVVDIAASDGVSQSCTLGLFSQKGWRGLAVEMDPEKFYTLAFLYSRFGDVKLVKNKVTPNNIVYLLKSCDVPMNFDVLNLDIDSYDLEVVDSLLKSEYRPKIITMEINEKIPAGIYFSVNFDENHYWKGDHFFGCSISAASEVVKKYKYILWRVEYNNAFFVRDDMIDERFIDLTPEAAYLSGYINKKDRRSIFSYNHDVDHWLELKADDAVEEIKKYFENYSGKFTLRVTLKI